jgi:CBS domain-containing protein
VQEGLLQRNARAFAVIAAGELAGLITLTDVRKVPRDQWPDTTVYRAMTPATRLMTVTPQQHLMDVLRIMVQHDINQLPVVRGRELVGMLDRGDVMRFIEIRRQLGEAAVPAEPSEPEHATGPHGANPRAS